MFIAHILFIICLIIAMIPIIIRLLVELRDFKNEYRMGQFNNPKYRNIQDKLEVIAFFCIIYIVIYGVIRLVMWLM